MSADLHIITFSPERIDPQVIIDYNTADYIDNSDGSFDMENIEYVQSVGEVYHNAVFGDINDESTWHRYDDDIWVGQVSWMKAGLFGEAGYREWIPRSVEAIQKLYNKQPGGILVITPQIIPVFTTAFSLPHDSHFEKRHADGQKSRGVNKARNIKKFLEANIGKMSFVESL